MTDTFNIDFTKICDIMLDGIDTKQYPEFEDAFICEAFLETSEEDSEFKDAKTGKWYRELNEEEIEYINSEHSDFVYECVMKKLF